MDGRLEFGRCMRICGPSGCGKTSALCKLLIRAENFFPCPPKRVMWVSGSGSRDLKVEKLIKSHYSNAQFIFNMPSSEELQQLIKEFDFWVFDDLSAELKNNPTFSNMFTKTVRHMNIMMAYLTQNPFEKGGDAATRSRNCSYQLFFPNKADVRWIGYLGSQLLGKGKQRHFERIFKKATSKPFSFLMCDHRALTPSKEQFIVNSTSPTLENPSFFLVAP